MPERNFRPYKGMIVKHFKGGIYEVLDVAKHTESEESLVIYQSAETGEVFAKPYDMFCDKVDTEKYPLAEQHYRVEELPFPCKRRAEAIISKFENLIAEASRNESPIRYDTETEEDLVLYFNQEYGKILVDKSFIKH